AMIETVAIVTLISLFRLSQTTPATCNLAEYPGLRGGIRPSRSRASPAASRCSGSGCLLHRASRDASSRDSTANRAHPLRVRRETALDADGQAFPRTSGLPEENDCLGRGGHFLRRDPKGRLRLCG